MGYDGSQWYGDLLCDEYDEQNNFMNPPSPTGWYVYKVVGGALDMMKEIATEGKINKITEMLGRYLNNLSNRDFQRFDEKYVKLIFYCLAMNLKPYRIISEQENNKTYQDIMLIPREQSKGYQAILIEFKYLKKEEAEQLEKTKKEAIEQVEKYSNLEEIKQIPNLNKYVVVAVNDEIYVEKV